MTRPGPILVLVCNMSMQQDTTIRNRTGLPVLLLVALALLAAGCRQPAGPQDSAPDIQLTVEVIPGQPAVGESALVVKLVDASGNPIDGASVSVRGDMTHAGMVPVIAETAESSGGEYLLDFEWTMAGDWILTVTATLPDGRTAVREFPLTVTPSQ